MAELQVFEACAQRIRNSSDRFRNKGSFHEDRTFFRSASEALKLDISAFDRISKSRTRENRSCSNILGLPFC